MSVRAVRVMILSCLWLIPFLIFFLEYHYGWHAVNAAFGVSAAEMSFPDLRGIAGALVTVRQHGDPLVANPGDPWNRPLNYPRIWLNLFSMLPVNEKTIVFVGLFLCILYLACISTLMVGCKRNADAFILLVASLSLAPLVAIQLGNTDLFIFALVFLGCAARANVLKSGSFFAASILKIYPIAAMAISALFQPAKKRAAQIFLVAVVLGIFCVQWRDLEAIRRATPISNWMAYGTLSMKAQVELGLGSSQGSKAGWAVIALCWMAGGLAVIAAWTSRFPLADWMRDSREGKMFSVFGAIYAFSFAIGSNWDYRLIFLVPTLPLAFELARDSTHRKWAIVYIGSILLAENPLDLRYIHGTSISHLTTFFLFLMVLTILTRQCKPYLTEIRRGFGFTNPLQAGTNIP